MINRLLKARRIVVKVGSALLVEAKSGTVKSGWLTSLVEDMLALREKAIPPTAHLQGRLDPACEGVDHVFEARRGVPLGAALSSSFAFGGSNAVLAFRAAPNA